MCSQFVFGGNIVTGGNAAFDVAFSTRIVGVSTNLHRVDDYASDVVVPIFYSRDAISKLFELIGNIGDDPLNIAFIFFIVLSQIMKIVSLLIYGSSAPTSSVKIGYSK